MDTIFVIVGVGTVGLVFPIIAAIVAFRKGHKGWGIATLMSIPFGAGFLIGIFALMQRAEKRLPTVASLQDLSISNQKKMAILAQPSMDGIETVCEKCKAKTKLGTYYSFMQGYKAGPSTKTGETAIYATRTVNPTPYKFAKSTGVYLCNKCVSLFERRITKVVFRNATFVIIALLVISIPVSIVMKTLYFLTPTMLLIFGGPLTIFHYQTLKVKEEAPLRAYADLYDNPEHPNPKKRFDPLLKQLLLNTGEKLAIEIKKPSLAKSGVDAFFTHEEAEKMKLVIPGKINLSKQKHDGISDIVIGSLLGIVTVILSLVFPKGGGVVIVFFASIFAISFLGIGIGILTSGAPGGMPGQTIHRYCPYCKYELEDDDLPTPGLHTVCPKCGRTFGRANW